MIPPANPGAPPAMRASTWPLLILALAGCSQQPPRQVTTMAMPMAPRLAPNECSQVGIASWYRGVWRDRTSRQDLVAAHRSLPFGTSVQVTALDTGQSIVVRINDRGPFGRGRVIDLSRAAADELGIRRDGVARVKLQPVGASDGSCPLLQAQSVE
jgi:peptidoglycan lytic transglycosylase